MVEKHQNSLSPIYDKRFLKVKESEVSDEEQKKKKGQRNMSVILKIMLDILKLQMKSKKS